MAACSVGEPPKTEGFQVSLLHDQYGSPSTVRKGHLQMGVKVNHSDRAVLAVHGTKKRKGDCVVTTKGNDTRKSLTLLRRAYSLGVGVRRA